MPAQRNKLQAAVSVSAQLQEKIQQRALMESRKIRSISRTHNTGKSKTILRSTPRQNPYRRGLHRNPRLRSAAEQVAQQGNPLGRGGRQISILFELDKS